MKFKPTKPAIYYRVSTDKQSIQSQRHDVEAFLKTEGYENPGKIPTYIDEGLSGKTTMRPEFQRMLKDVAHGRIDCIVVYKLDRLSRSAGTAIKLLIDLDDANIGFLSATQGALNINDMPFRKMLFAAFAEIAEIERETIVERIKSGIAAARANGVKLGPPVRCNYKIKREILKLKDDGLSMRTIANLVDFSVGKVHKVIHQ